MSIRSSSAASVFRMFTWNSTTSKKALVSSYNTSTFGGSPFHRTRSSSSHTVFLVCDTMSITASLTSRDLVLMYASNASTSILMLAFTRSVNTPLAWSPR